LKLITCLAKLAGFYLGITYSWRSIISKPFAHKIAILALRNIIS
jgi:hypothetical protein